ncbi:MAG: hypothetical protein ABIT83_25860 [Massilia sp.]
MACRKQVGGVLARELTVLARIDGARRAVLVGARASSAISGASTSLRQRFARWLRASGWIEPETLEVRGRQFDSADMLARFALDALAANGWYRSCAEATDTPACVEMARTRSRSGPPALAPAPVPVGAALELERAMAGIEFAPLNPRGADGLPEDSLMVSLDDGAMWLHFVSRDLSQQQYDIAIRLAVEGGAPTLLRATLDKQVREVALAGSARRDNGGALVLLAPGQGGLPARAGYWLHLPNDAWPFTFRQLADTLPRIDPAFAGPIIKTLLASVASPTRPDDELGLYPPLHTVEHRAALLRRARAGQWLSRDKAGELIGAAFKDDPITRAAWAMASCEPERQQDAAADPGCWSRFALNDPAAAGLLLGEIRAQQTVYGALEPGHPLRLRLKALGTALSVE